MNQIYAEQIKINKNADKPQRETIKDSGNDEHQQNHIHRFLSGRLLTRVVDHVHVRRQAHQPVFILSVSNAAAISGLTPQTITLQVSS